MQPPSVCSFLSHDRRDVAVRPLATSVADEKRRPTILLIGDDASVREGIRRVLTHEALHVVTARGVKDALEHLEQAAPDLIITDLCMAPLSGWNLLAHLEYSQPALPVFLISAVPLAPTSRAHGKISAFFPKPIDLDLLLAAIRRQLGTSVSHRLAVRA